MVACLCERLLISSNEPTFLILVPSMMAVEGGYNRLVSWLNVLLGRELGLDMG